MHRGNSICSEQVVFTNTHTCMDMCDNNERKRGHDREKCDYTIPLGSKTLI